MGQIAALQVCYAVPVRRAKVGNSERRGRGGSPDSRLSKHSVDPGGTLHEQL